MRRIINSNRLTKYGKEFIDSALQDIFVSEWDKRLLKGIKDSAGNKRLTRAECDLLDYMNKRLR